MQKKNEPAIDGTKAKNGIKYLGVRIPFELHAEIEQVAKDEDRTLNSFVLNLLKREVAERKAGKK